VRRDRGGGGREERSGVIGEGEEERERGEEREGGRGGEVCKMIEHLSFIKH
jgi:hypothetical protein